VILAKLSNWICLWQSKLIGIHSNLAATDFVNPNRYLICLTIGPAFFTACIYLCLSRVITVIGSEHSRLHPRTYTKVFIGCDLLALILQAVGGALASTAKDHAHSKTGTNVMIAGLVSQVISIFLFLGLWLDFALRVRKARRSEMPARNQGSLYLSLLRGSRKFTFFQWSESIPSPIS
jgi:RTA1 like protein